jgi:S-adenosylmethionine synthetase
MKEKVLFSSESVSEGHPDKLCDQIADAILDDCLSRDKMAHVACEVFATSEYILIGGEITTSSPIVPQYEQIARRVLKEVGYTDKKIGIGCDTCKIDVRVKKQSPNIENGIRHGNNILNNGAGDQGIMFGYATNETEGYMPLAISIAHKLVRVASSLRKEGKFPHARPDMKSEVTIDYSDINHIRVESVLMSIQHDSGVDIDEFKKFILNNIMKPVISSFNLNNDFTSYINTAGAFEIGGPEGDTGLTGRKIIVDTYGGSARHGGGSFSGKDPSKVDRSAAYYARYIAKNLVAAGISDRLEVQLGYAIGVAHPLSIGISTFNTEHYDEETILSIIRKVFDARPGAIIKQFHLNEPTWKYADLANYGHFGRPDIDCPWEKLDKVEEIKKLLNK